MYRTSLEQPTLTEFDTVTSITHFIEISDLYREGTVIVVYKRHCVVDQTQYKKIGTGMKLSSTNGVLLKRVG